MMAEQPAKETLEPESMEIDDDGLPLPVWGARLSLYFLLQGVLVLLSYAYYGFGTNPNRFGLGFRLDPLHAGVHLVWGLVGSIIGFYLPAYATLFILAFAAFYTVLAVLGSFTPYSLGLPLNSDIDLFYWCLVVPAWAIGLYALWRERTAPAA